MVAGRGEEVPAQAGHLTSDSSNSSLMPLAATPPVLTGRLRRLDSMRRRRDQH